MCIISLSENKWNFPSFKTFWLKRLSGTIITNAQKHGSTQEISHVCLVFLTWATGKVPGEDVHAALLGQSNASEFADSWHSAAVTPSYDNLWQTELGSVGSVGSVGCCFFQITQVSTVEAQS